MLLRSISLLLSLHISTTFGLSVSFPDGQSVPLSSQNASYSFGLKALNDVIADGENNIFSPANIYACLWVLYEGAEGDTKQELKNVLGDPDIDQFMHQLRSIQDLNSNGILFVDPHLKLETKFEEKFRDVIIPMDFRSISARRYINHIVYVVTNGTIPAILDSNAPPETLAILVSILYFKAAWLHPFDPMQTKIGKFEVNSNETINIPLMTLGGTFPYLHEKNYEVVGLPYLNNGCTLYLILPNASGLNQLKQVMRSMTSSKFNKVQEKLVNTSVIVKIPKFSVDYKVELAPILKTAGVKAMFDPISANFSSMGKGAQNVYVTQVTHTVHLEVDESGTTAAAGTVAVLAKTVPIFRASRPFGLILHHSSGHTLLLGTISKPTCSASACQE